MELSDLDKACQKAELILGLHGLTVYAADVPSWNDVLSEAPPLRWASLCVTTVAVLEGAGLSLLPTREHPHWTLVLPERFPLAEVKSLFRTVRNPQAVPRTTR
ncbi:MAG: hypothetical protein JWM85_2239 [Acidimicrobiaceae bacterium]|nr:hypothetical protein [Acidimicrobiaceae bacterium]